MTNLAVTNLYVSKGFFPRNYFSATVDYLAEVQQPDGAIPWFAGGHLDPWDHVESAMGLAVGGRLAESERAYRWLARTQLGDGGWWSAYRDGQPTAAGRRRETHFAAYVAVGVWHHHLIAGGREFLTEMWPMVRRAIDFALAHQAPSGEIYWAQGADGEVWRDALVTGCSSIYKSLECAIHIARALDRGAHRWRTARRALGRALRARPERFDRTWESNARFSMDWYYPVLAGVLDGELAKARLAGRWDAFVVEGMGCRCIDDHDWVTVAESAELVLALLAAGHYAKAAELFSWLHRWRDESGAYWTGFAYGDGEIWPEERPTWTAGAVLLAADALTQATPAARLFTEASLADTAEDAERVHHLDLFEEAGGER